MEKVAFRAMMLVLTLSGRINSEVNCSNRKLFDR
jgi:hypothetical protein